MGTELQIREMSAGSIEGMEVLLISGIEQREGLWVFGPEPAERIMLIEMGRGGEACHVRRFSTQ